MKSAMDTFTLNPVKTPKQTRYQSSFFLLFFFRSLKQNFSSNSALKQESTKLQQDLENEKKLRKKLESEISTLKSQLHEAQSSSSFFSYSFLFFLFFEKSNLCYRFGTNENGKEISSKPNREIHSSNNK